MMSLNLYHNCRDLPSLVQGLGKVLDDPNKMVLFHYICQLLPEEAQTEFDRVAAAMLTGGVCVNNYHLITFTPFSPSSFLSSFSSLLPFFPPLLLPFSLSSTHMPSGPDVVKSSSASEPMGDLLYRVQSGRLPAEGTAGPMHVPSRSTPGKHY